MQNYIQEIQKYWADTNSSEHSYRTSFENALKEIFPVSAGYFTQQDQKAIGGNKPDFIIIKDKVPVLYIEVKKVGEDLNKIEKSGQAARYFGYDNLIISDYVNFRFYRNGQKYNEEISLGDIHKSTRTINTKIENAVNLTKTIVDFTNGHKEAIKSGKHLAEIMGGKAKRLRDNVLEMLNSEEKYAELFKMRDVVQQNLIAGLDDEKFADMYAQTLVYGLFAARFNDNSPNSFSRTEARELVPKTNPFLASFFDHIAGVSFPKRLAFMVDELCEVFTHADIEKLLHDFYKKEKDNKDPIIHFYEDFLHEYDSKKKMEMGVFYTPRPVVQFIVRAVDEILKTDFNIAKGLADNTKIITKEKIIDPKSKIGKEILIDKEYHKVQVLDVATGTGTFLNEVIMHVYKSFEGQEGRWKSYVESDLLPRLHGFELMMASYTIAHLKLGMTLHETGAGMINKRLGVYLTNTLEEASEYKNQGNLFGLMDSIAEESKNASRIKSEYPIMCVIGNPPYAVSSSNKGKWIQDKLEDYKKGLNEKKINIDDDYIKFIRFAQYMVDKNTEGIVAYISNNSFVNGITHRKMRESLLKSFDSIYILDLHGNARKQEVSPDGSKDQNVFDIMQGVSINIFVKTNKKEKNELGKVFSYDLFGDRKYKYNFLDTENLSSIKWQDLNYTQPYYFFQKKDFLNINQYQKGFSLTSLFKIYSAGIKTKVDNISTDFKREDLKNRISDIIQSKYSLKEIIVKFNLNPKTTWEYNKVLEIKDFDESKIVEYSYRPLDTRFVYFDHKFLSRSRQKVMSNIKNNNLALSFIHQGKGKGPEVLITDSVVCEDFITNHTFTASLYLYIDQGEKIANLDKGIWGEINKIISNDGANEASPEDILDYVYGYLHDKNYREKYNEFLKIDFPRVPYPSDKNEFDKYVNYGNKLRLLHLMDQKTLEGMEIKITFPEGGSDEVEDKYPKYILDSETKDIGRMYINEIQYFGNVSKEAFEFFIGGYQPAQKYLKDRKSKKLSNDEIENYINIIKVLGESYRLMGEFK